MDIKQKLDRLLPEFQDAANRNDNDALQDLVQEAGPLMSELGDAERYPYEIGFTSIMLGKTAEEMDREIAAECGSDDPGIKSAFLAATSEEMKSVTEQINATLDGMENTMRATSDSLEHTLADLRALREMDDARGNPHFHQGPLKPQ